MPIYTKEGDKGYTSLSNNQKINKDSPIINFVGSLDELNAMLGVCAASLTEIDEEDFSTEVEVVQDIQRDLFIVGSIAVGAKLKFAAEKEVSNIEKTIDDYSRLLPKLKNFVLPGGDITAANLHLARTLVRKIERQAVALNSKSMEPFLPYLNRLSDLLFLMARYVNYKLKKQEIIWKT